MLVLPSSRFFLLSPIFSLAAVVPFRLVFNFSLRTRFSISRFVLRFFEFRSFVRSFFECLSRDLVVDILFSSVLFYLQDFSSYILSLSPARSQLTSLSCSFCRKELCVSFLHEFQRALLVCSFSLSPSGFQVSSRYHVSRLHCAVREQCCSSLFLVIRRYVSIF